MRHECVNPDCPDKPGSVKDTVEHTYGDDTKCSTCGYDKSVPHTHDLTPVAAQAATCTKAGNKAYYICTGCDGWFSDAEGTEKITDTASVVIPAKGHTPSDWKHTDTNHWKECTVPGCGNKTTESHTFKWVVDVAATANTKGSQHEECTTCGYKRAAVDIPATGPVTRPTNPTNPTNPTKPAENKPIASPKTGDSSTLGLWSVTLCTSLAACLTLAAAQRRRKKEL